MSGLEDPEHPLAVDGVEVVPTADGYVVYDEQRDRVHYLNHTAVLVLEFCTGENTQRRSSGCSSSPTICRSRPRRRRASA